MELWPNDDAAQKNATGGCMGQGETIGYLVPQFPGQTHIFFWREIAALEVMRVTPVLFPPVSRPPV